MTVTEEDSSFPYLREFAAEMQIPRENLIQVFRIESEFHRKILETENHSDRQAMYAELYATVHPLLQPTSGAEVDPTDGIRWKRARNSVLLFRNELTGKSVLDVGCGDGQFLLTIHDLLPHGELLGLDISETWQTSRAPHPAHVKFLRQSIVSFTLPRTFDVVCSSQVLEHLAPSDLPEHLRSVRDALAPGGQFILSLPNRFWGPNDITRIVDNTYTGRVPAQGSHLNESTYTELIPLLHESGFQNIKTTLPFAHEMPFLRPVRVSPWLNQLVERPNALRAITRALRRRGRPIFRNMIVLICSKTPSGSSVG